MPVSNIDALVREAVCGESSSSPASSSDKSSSASSMVQGNSLKRRLPSADNFNSGNNGINSLLSSSLDFVKADAAFENPLYDALEQNPKIIHVSKNAQMFRSFSYFSRNNSSSSGNSHPHQQQHPVNGVKKELHNGRSPNHVQDDIPAPKFNLFQGRIDVEWRSSSLQAGGGLHNQGNTCFLNSVLQCLAYTAPLYNVLVEENHSGQSCRIQNQTCMLCEIQKTLKRIFDHPQNAISPNGIVGRIREIGKCFHPGRQEDAHEFLIHLFDSMQKACLHNKPKLDNYTQSTSLLHQIFGGFCRSQVICSRCHNRSNTYDPFLTLSIDVQHCNSIKDSLARYTKKEFLGNANMYKCEKCKQKVDATRRVTFQRLPKILVLHLKRFNYNGLNMKLSKHLNFPDKLELNSFLSESVCKSGAQYSLYAVLVHSGFSSHSGHYYCFVKSPSGVWYKCNDSHVSKCSLNLALQSEAYMLFYSQKSQQNLKNGILNTSTSSTNELNQSSESIPLISNSSPSPKVKPHSVPKQKLSSENIPNGLAAATASSNSNEPSAVTFPKVGANYNYQNNYKDHSPDNQGDKPKPVVEAKPVASVRPTLSFKIPKRTELNEANDAKNSKMLQKANENLLQRCSSSTDVSSSMKQSETHSSSSDSFSSSYDRLHPFASSVKSAVGGKKALTGENPPNGHIDSSLANSSGANGLVPYSFADDSDGSDSDDESARAKGDSDGPPLAKVPKTEVPPKLTSQLTNDENSSSISSNLSFFTSSSGSNSENNLCAKSQAGKESAETTTVTAIDANYQSADKLPQDVVKQRKEVVSISLPCSPRLQDNARTTRNNFDFVNGKELLSTDKKSSQDEECKEGTLTVSTNCSMFEETMSDINGDARSPSVSSNDSKSSMGSTKKISHLQKLKEKVKSVKQKIKSNKPVASTFRRNPSTVKSATKICSSEDENASTARESPRQDVATSPHVDHNYVTRSFNGVPTSINNKTDSTFQTPKHEVNGTRKQNVANENASSGGWNERSKASHANNQQQPRTPSQPVCVPRKGLVTYGQFSATNTNSAGVGSQSVDVIDRLNQQTVTKSWNGDSSLDSSKRFFTYANNNNSYDSYHNKSRQYDEIDSELDRGHARKRKSHDPYGHSYGHDNGYSNGGGGHYKGYNNNNYWYGKPEQRHVNKFQYFHENRGKSMGYYGDSFSNRYRGRGANQHYR